MSRINPPPPASSIYVDQAYNVQYAKSASFVQSAGGAAYVSPNANAVLSGLNLVGGGVTGSLGANQVQNISSSQAIDVIPLDKGNSVRWMVFLDSGSNSRANKVVASWNNTTSNFYVTEIKSIGEVPVNLTVGHSSSGISLVATPETGVWGVKLIRIMI